MTMRDEQEQSIKENPPPPQEDSRIDILIRAYRNLAVKVDLLQEQIQELETELARQQELRKNIARVEGNAPPLALSAPMPDKPEAKEEPAGQKSKPKHSAKSRPKRAGQEKSSERLFFTDCCSC